MAIPPKTPSIGRKILMALPDQFPGNEGLLGAATVMGTCHVWSWACVGWNLHDEKVRRTFDRPSLCGPVDTAAREIGPSSRNGLTGVLTIPNEPQLISDFSDPGSVVLPRPQVHKMQPPYLMKVGDTVLQDLYNCRRREVWA